MKRILFFSFMISCVASFAQNGFIKFANDSVARGFIRPAFLNGQSALEIWRTKNDKQPVKIPKSLINEYAIKKDTFRVLHHFVPFPEHDKFLSPQTYYETVDAEIISRGKVNLLKIEESRVAGTAPYGTMGTVQSNNGKMVIISTLYILENGSTGFIRSLPNDQDQIYEVLFDFFPDRYVTKYEELHGKIKYKTIPELVKYYNLKSKKRYNN